MASQISSRCLSLHCSSQFIFLLSYLPSLRCLLISLICSLNLSTSPGKYTFCFNVLIISQVRRVHTNATSFTFVIACLGGVTPSPFCVGGGVISATGDIKGTLLSAPPVRRPRNVLRNTRAGEGPPTPVCSCPRP